MTLTVSSESTSFTWEPGVTIEKAKWLASWTHLVVDVDANLAHGERHCCHGHQRNHYSELEVQAFSFFLRCGDCSDKLDPLTVAHQSLVRLICYMLWLFTCCIVLNILISTKLASENFPSFPLNIVQLAVPKTAFPITAKIFKMKIPKAAKTLKLKFSKQIHYKHLY